MDSRKDFLQTIEGRSGEGMATAVLQFLLERPSRTREKLFSRIRAEVPSLGGALPRPRDQVTCLIEATCTQEDGSSGRIDLIVSSPGVVLGIESKFWAVFTPDQPKKYVRKLKEKGEIEEKPWRLVVLAPADRQPALRRHLQEQRISEDTSIIFWHDLLAEHSDESEPNFEIAAVERFFEQHIRHYQASNPLDISQDQLLGHQTKIGASKQRRFLEAVRSSIPSAGKICQSRQTAGDQWIGFYFRDLETSFGPTSEPVPSQWFGITSNLREPGGNHLVGIHSGDQRFTKALQAGELSDCESGRWGAHREWNSIL